jgi:hypothetical protein
MRPALANQITVVINASCLPRTVKVTEIDLRPMQKP